MLPQQSSPNVYKSSPRISLDLFERQESLHCGDYPDCSTGTRGCLCGFKDSSFLDIVNSFSSQVTTTLSYSKSSPTVTSHSHDWTLQPSKRTAVEPPPKATVAPVVCNRKTSKEGCGWKDVKYKDLKECIHVFFVEGDMDSSSLNQSQTLNHKDPRPLLNIGWIPGCDTYRSQDPQNPVGDHSVASGVLFNDAFKNCKPR